MEIEMDPDGDTRIYTLKSPRYPSKYPHNQDCKWIFTAKTGKVKLLFDKFNVEWSSSCKKKDYLFVGSIAKYTKTWLCGSSIPKKFKLVSKKDTMTLKFHSNSKVTKSGFKVRLIATG